MIILKKFIFIIIIFSFINISSQTFQWGVRAGFGFSCYDSGETEFTNGKGDEYSIEEETFTNNLAFRVLSIGVVHVF